MKIAKVIDRVVAVGMLAVAATLSATAFARPITLSFNGTVTHTSFDPFDPLAGPVLFPQMGTVSRPPCIFSAN